MLTTERRIAALEQRSPDSDGLVVFVTSGRGEDTDLCKLRSFSGGQCWERQAGESIEQFKVRAAVEVVRSDYGAAVLLPR